MLFRSSCGSQGCVQVACDDRSGSGDGQVRWRGWNSCRTRTSRPLRRASVRSLSFVSPSTSLISTSYSAVPIVEAMAALVIMECVPPLDAQCSRTDLPFQRRPPPKCAPRRCCRSSPARRPPPSVHVDAHEAANGYRGRGAHEQGLDCMLYIISIERDCEGDAARWLNPFQLWTRACWPMASLC